MESLNDLNLTPRQMLYAIAVYQKLCEKAEAIARILHPSKNRRTWTVDEFPDVWLVPPWEDGRLDYDQANVAEEAWEKDPSTAIDPDEYKDATVSLKWEETWRYGGYDGGYESIPLSLVLDPDGIEKAEIRMGLKQKAEAEAEKAKAVAKAQAEVDRLQNQLKTAEADAQAQLQEARAKLQQAAQGGA